MAGNRCAAASLAWATPGGGNAGRLRMDNSPDSGGRSVASVFVAVMVLTIALAMIVAGGGMRPLTAPKSAVAMAPGHPRQG